MTRAARARRTSTPPTATIHALQGIDLAVDEGEIVTLIGANGAGKTHDAADDLRPAPAAPGRRSRFDGKRHRRRCAPHEIVELGVCQSPEGRRIFSRMTVQENLELGAFSRKDKAEIAGRLRAGLRAVPAAEGAPRTRRPARCPAASSRCWPSAGR